MKVAPGEGPSLVNTQRDRNTYAIHVAVTSHLPRTAPGQGLIPQERHLRVQPRTNGNPTQ
eukprot:6086994-Prorocentrum_lima.AAC.1